MIGYMDRKCQDCIAIASASVVATAAITATVDLADLVIHSTLAASTLISIAPAFAAVAARTLAHPTADTTVHVPALDTAPVTDGSLYICAVNLGLHRIPTPLRENEVADPWRPPREIEAPDGVVTYAIVEEASIRRKDCEARYKEARL